MKHIRKFFRFMLISGTSLMLLGLITLAGVYFYIAPKLPSVEVLRDMRFQVPLQVYSQDHQLIAEYGSKKRTPISFLQTPEHMVHAVLAAEDDRFFEHPGVDYQGILRAVFELIKTGQKSQGGSTITMQVARNFFLSSEKTYLRKINEIFLALKIERELSKEQILELYFNKIFLGNRAYGIGSASQIYYGRNLDQLTLAEIAMIAGLPKAPSRYNPLANPERAVIRRNYVLGRMHELQRISDDQYNAARTAPVTAKLHKAAIDLEAPFIGEMVRSHMYELYGEETYTNGFKVYVTIDPKLQLAAQNALRNGLTAYDQRHGYRGPIKQLTLTPETDPTILLEQLADMPNVGGLEPVLIYEVGEQHALALLRNGNHTQLPWEGLSWAARYQDTNHQGPRPQNAAEVLNPGDVVYVQLVDDSSAAPVAHLRQIPTVSGAIVALDPNDGSLIALAGGFDFFYSKFNRATQAKRQPGSSFKPFVYSAALEKGFTPASIINDAPVVFDDAGLESSWRPENYSGKFYGPTRLRLALTKSRNLVSIRLLQSIGISYTIDYLSQFGFDPKDLPRDLSLSLGSASVTPMEIASAYTTFANGGYKVSPYFIQRIEDIKGNVIYETRPQRACPECDVAQMAAEAAVISDTNMDAIDDAATILEDAPQPIDPGYEPAMRAITPQNSYLITSMMRDVVQYGTGRKALQLKRKDLAGKTGTTNDQRDAWFSGFNSDIVTISWAGFDNSTPLGNFETGAKAALPMWIEFMRSALQDRPETPLQQPSGLITVRIDPNTGLLAGADQENAIFETFRNENVPTRKAANVDDSVKIIQDDNTETPTPQLLF